MNQDLDGSVIPSNLQYSEQKTANDFVRRNTQMRSGVVTDIIYPDDNRSLSKIFIEYDVLVSHADSENGFNASIYRNCKCVNVFGQASNSLTYTLIPGVDDGTGVYDRAASVLLLCVDGFSDAGQSVIIGGLSDADGKTYSKADGQFYDFNFNGININIDNSGEFLVQFNSPDDASGNPTNSAAAGSSIKIDLQGRVSLNDNIGQKFILDRVAKTATWTNGNDSILIDQGNKQITITSTGGFTTQSAKDTTIDANGAMNVSSTKDMSISSQSNLNTNISSSINENVGSNWTMTIGGNVNISSGGNLNITGTGNAIIGGEQTTIGTSGATPVALVGITMSIGVGNLGIPISVLAITGSNSVLAGI
jgi:hypothetical protein